MARKIIVQVLRVMLIVASSRASSWGENVFPDDIELVRFHPKEHLSGSDIAKRVDDDGVCETQECEKVAAEFLRGMNQSMDPCEDFYEFSCGGWGANITIPPSSMVWDRDSLYQDIVYYRLKEILENKPNSNDILPVKQAKRWYRSCMDTARLEQRGIGPIETIVMQVGGWPIVTDEKEWDVKQYPWQNVERHYARITGSHAFYDINAHPAWNVREFRAIRIGPPKFLIARESLIKEKSYNDMIMKVISMFMQEDESPLSVERIKAEALEVMKFESDLWTLMVETEWGYNISKSDFEMWEKSDMYLEEFVEWYDETTIELIDEPKAKIDWISVIGNVFEIADVSIDLDIPIYVNNMAYIKGIGKLLQRTSERTIVNYVHWDFIANMLPYTTEDLREYIFKMKYQKFGVTGSESRCLECARRLTETMTYAAAYIFAENYFTNSTESAALAMLKAIQHTLEKNIEKSNWLDEDSKVLAKDKLNSMEIFMGLPEWYKNRTAISKVYSGLVIQDEYFDNALSYMRYERRADFKRFRSWDDDSQETMHSPMSPLTLNAEYDMENKINLPPVNFQSPLFTPGLPDNVNYGLSGFTIGHEMSHGFDDSGISFGEDITETLLTHDMLKSYYQRAECFVNQFGGYYGKSESITSRNNILAEITKGENIADSTGLQAVFQAYQEVNKKKPCGDTKLPGLEGFTDDQLFFLSFAAAWCGSQRPEYLSQQKASDDPHSPARLRVIGAVSNTKDFAKVFKCRKGSSMNPIDKCSIWEKPGATPQTVSAIMRKYHEK